MRKLFGVVAAALVAVGVFAGVAQANHVDAAGVSCDWAFAQWSEFPATNKTITFTVTQPGATTEVHSVGTNGQGSGTAQVVLHLTGNGAILLTVTSDSGTDPVTAGGVDDCREPVATTVPATTVKPATPTSPSVAPSAAATPATVAQVVTVQPKLTG